MVPVSSLPKRQHHIFRVSSEKRRTRRALRRRKWGLKLAHISEGSRSGEKFSSWIIMCFWLIWFEIGGVEEDWRKSQCPCFHRMHQRSGDRSSTPYFHDSNASGCKPAKLLVKVTGWQKWDVKARRRQFIVEKSGAAVEICDANRDEFPSYYLR